LRIAKWKRSLFTTHTAELGRLLALSKIRLIYGGGNAGLMGVVANASPGRKR